MRVVFFVVIIALFQLCAFLVGRGAFWLIAPYFPHARTVVMVATFVLSNAFLATLFFGQFRLAMGYLAVLWLAVLAMIAVCVVNFLLQKFAPAGGDLAQLTMRLFAILLFGGLIGLSVRQAYTPVVRHLTITIDKPMVRPVKLAMASDLHLGSLFGAKYLHKLAQILRQEQADILLMPGDIMDDNTKIYDAQNMKPAFDEVVRATKGGVVASLGNHDLYDVASRSAIVQAVQATGAVLLDDKVSVFDVNGVPVAIIGRFDDHKDDRKTTAALLDELPEQAKSYPVILLDHRPSQIDENVKLPIDLQVSGHTHNGQVFPANVIVQLLNRVGYGHKKINDTHIVVSSGYGFWGIPFRLGSQSEIWLIELHGNN